MTKPGNVDEYIANAAPDARPVLEQLRALIASSLPDVEERISYGVPFYELHGQLGGFSAYKKHVSFGVATALLPEDRQRLEQQGYTTGSKTVQIKFDQKVPTATIKRVLKAQAKRNAAGRTSDEPIT